MEKWQRSIINVGKCKNGFPNSKNDIKEIFCRLWGEILGECSLENDNLSKVQSVSTVEFKVSDHKYLLGIDTELENEFEIEITFERRAPDITTKRAKRTKILVGCSYKEDELYYYYTRGSSPELNDSTKNKKIVSVNYNMILNNLMNLLIDLQEDKLDEWHNLIDMCGGEEKI